MCLVFRCTRIKVFGHAFISTESGAGTEICKTNKHFWSPLELQNFSRISYAWQNGTLYKSIMFEISSPITFESTPKLFFYIPYFGIFWIIPYNLSQNLSYRMVVKSPYLVTVHSTLLPWMCTSIIENLAWQLCVSFICFDLCKKPTRYCRRKMQIIHEVKTCDQMALIHM